MLDFMFVLSTILLDKTCDMVYSVFPFPFFIFLLQSDPMLVVYTRGRDGVLKEVGRTEVMLNSLNPKWINTLNVTFQFEIVQTML